MRLTRAGKGTTFCRTRKPGRTQSSVCNRPAALQSPPLRRCHANLGGTWLWTGCASGHSSCLLIDGFEEWQSPEADADLRYYHARASQLARMAALGRLHVGSYGEHGSVLEVYLRDSGGSFPDRGGQRATRQEGSGAQD